MKVYINDKLWKIIIYEYDLSMVLKDEKVLSYDKGILIQRRLTRNYTENELGRNARGKMHFHESFEDTCYRETLEET